MLEERIVVGEKVIIEEKIVTEKKVIRRENGPGGKSFQKRE